MNQISLNVDVCYWKIINNILTIRNCFIKKPLIGTKILRNCLKKFCQFQAWIIPDLQNESSNFWKVSPVSIRKMSHASNRNYFLVWSYRRHKQSAATISYQIKASDFKKGVLWLKAIQIIRDTFSELFWPCPPPPCGSLSSKITVYEDFWGFKNLFTKKESKN